MIAAGRRVKVMPQMKVEQGITAARAIFGKRFFDSEKCSDGIQALRHYRYEVEEAKSDPAGGHIALSKVPRHDWASHGADAFRTASVMIREPEKEERAGEAEVTIQVIAMDLKEQGCPCIELEPGLQQAETHSRQIASNRSPEVLMRLLLWNALIASSLTLILPQAR
jgi:hypothetical protein